MELLLLVGPAVSVSVRVVLLERVVAGSVVYKWNEKNHFILQI